MYRRSTEEYEEIIINLTQKIKAWNYLYEEQRAIIDAYRDIINKYREILDDRTPSSYSE